MKILVVEDNNDLAVEIKTLLLAKRMVVERVATIEDAEEYLRSSKYDVIILDWNLPDGIGLDLLHNIRTSGIHTPVLMLTERSSIKDKEQGFNAGTDDYLTKPFHPTELICRIHALVKRPPQRMEEIIKSGPLSLEPASGRVTKEGREISLSPKEFALLEFFMRNPNQIFKAETLQERVWETDNEATSQTVVATILRLRKKIDTPGSPTRIKNQFALGYMFDD